MPRSVSWRHPSGLFHTRRFGGDPKNADTNWLRKCWLGFVDKNCWNHIYSNWIWGYTHALGWHLSQEKRIWVKPLLSKNIMNVCITFLWAVPMPVIIAVKPLILCLRDCASYPTPGLHYLAAPAHRPVFSSTFPPWILSWWIFPRERVWLFVQACQDTTIIWGGCLASPRWQDAISVNTSLLLPCYLLHSSHSTKWS